MRDVGHYLSGYHRSGLAWRGQHGAVQVVLLWGLGSCGGVTLGLATFAQVFFSGSCMGKNGARLALHAELMWLSMRRDPRAGSPHRTYYLPRARSCDLLDTS